ncbi:DUF1836 domain-containing protein [Streptococcus caballi]|uniref:DUF1836 domain-containing protein n=1 Tax=Streptococcus caballi TaxID=439220 RepID=UPI000371D167|nr:DUF1836 domain-containing protein [Streptococcus caballi]
MRTYPKWAELPEIDLYLDQVLLYVNQVTRSAIFQNDKGLTASMINNYVKHGHVDKPVKKKYSRKQVARLIVITALKNVFSIQEISQTLEILTADNHSQQAYDGFVACMNDKNTENLPQVVISACQTLKLYEKTHELVLELKGGTSDDRKPIHENEVK